MYPPLFWAVLVTLIQLVLFFGQNGVGANFSDNCDNSTNSLSCIHTYEQLYHILAEADNSFKIESALYPAKRPSSVRVFVNLYGLNKTENPMAKYTWSLSCLYVAIPASFLEISSLGSILVTRRTQNLEMKIPYFCCNVSKKEDGRKKTIGDMIERVLASLQDLARSPGIRDPTLNTAECITEGHRLNVEATESCLYITILLCLPVFITAFTSAPFVLLLEGFRNECLSENPESRPLITSGEKRRIYKAVLVLNYVLACSSIFFFISLAVSVTHGELSEEMTQGQGYTFGEIILLLILVPQKPVFEISSSLVIIVFCNSGSCSWKNLKCVVNEFVFSATAAFTSYCSCWMLIGIMLNPTWGLTVALMVYSTFAAFAYTVYLYLSLRSVCAEEIPDALQPCMSVFLSFIGIMTMAILAGQSFNGRETADEILKTVILTFLGSFISWLSLKRPLNIHPESQNAQTQTLSISSTSISPPSQTDFALGSMLEIVVHDPRQPSSNDPFTNHDPSQTSIAGGSFEKIVVEEHEPPLRGTSSNETLRHTPPAGNILK